MKTSKMAKILSAILALAVILCSLPFALGVTASAEGTTLDYSAMANLLKPSIADYTDTFGMHDGVGLRVKDGALIPDGDWFYQLDYIDKYVDATPAYAIYDVTPNTEFVANFSATTDTSAMKFYASENMVDWYLLGTAGDEKTVTANLPYYANYLKIAWPLGANEKNGILSVSFVKPEADANEIVINYKKATTGTSTMVGSGLNDVNVLNNRGVWQSNGINFNGTGVLAPDWTRLNNATSANSFDGYVTYKVQPETRFSMTVSTSKAINSSWTAYFPFDGVAQKLGYENPADWNLEIYVSEDNVNFTRLNEAELRTMTARYPNNIAEHGNAYRTTEYNFIVPEGMAYVKAKFPMTQNLSTVKDAEGNAVMGGCGNDIFSINKVEFTRAKYDYRTLASGDYSVGSAISADTMADFGMSAYSGITVTSTSGIDVPWKSAGQTYAAYAQYDVTKGTPFYAGIRIHWTGGMTGYIGQKESYSIKLQGYNASTAAWDDVDVLTFDSSYSGGTDYALNMSSEDSVYDKVRVYWNFVAGSGDYCGNNLACLSEVAFTPKTIYDYTKCTDSATMGDYGIVSQSTKNKVIADKNGKGLVLDYSGVADYSTQGGAGVAHIAYKVEEGSIFKLNFSKNTWYNNAACAEKYNNPDYLIKAYSSADENFTETTLYTATTTDNVNYTIEFTVPAGENNIKVTFPQQGRLSDQWNAGGWYDYVGQDYLYLKSVEITKADLELDWINVDTVPTTGRYYKGDAFKADGLVVGLSYTSGEYRRIDTGFDYEVDTNVVGANLIPVSYAGMESSFMVEVYVYDGDFNCDKNVNMLDLIRLKKIAVSAGVSDGADADIDGSGAVDGGDLTRMKKFILGASEAV